MIKIYTKTDEKGISMYFPFNGSREEGEEALKIKQLIIISDMEGASGIFDNDILKIVHGSEEWRKYGRESLTSDVLAICEAANEFGIDEILIYDGHYAGNPEPNIISERLPKNVRFFDVPDRCFFWRRIRGQAAQLPFGLITVGQHARFGEENAYFPHTIQTPPIKSLWLNQIHIAEIGQAVLNFQGVKYLANIGCKASMKEAVELNDKIVQIPVKDKAKAWAPDPKETFNIIKEGVLRALNLREDMEEIKIDGPYKFRMELCKYFYFNAPEEISWKGNFQDNVAYWEAPSVEIGLEIFNYVREYIRKDEVDI